MKHAIQQWVNQMEHSDKPTLLDELSETNWQTIINHMYNVSVCF